MTMKRVALVACFIVVFLHSVLALLLFLDTGSALEIILSLFFWLLLLTGAFGEW